MNPAKSQQPKSDSEISVQPQDPRKVIRKETEGTMAQDTAENLHSQPIGLNLSDRNNVAKDNQLIGREVGEIALKNQARGYLDVTEGALPALYAAIDQERLSDLRSVNAELPKYSFNPETFFTKNQES
jgi:hypothetical protein